MNEYEVKINVWKERVLTKTLHLIGFKSYCNFYRPEEQEESTIICIPVGRNTGLQIPGQT